MKVKIVTEVKSTFFHAVTKSAKDVTMLDVTAVLEAFKRLREEARTSITEPKRFQSTSCTGMDIA